MRKVFEKEGYGTPAYNKAQQAISDELMTIRFTAKTIEKLCDMLRAQVDDVRTLRARICARSWSTSAACPQGLLHRSHFADRNAALEPEVGRKASRRRQALTARCMGRNMPPCRNCSKADRHRKPRVVVPLDDLKDINKRMNEGEAPRATPRRK